MHSVASEDIEGKQWTRVCCNVIYTHLCICLKRVPPWLSSVSTYDPLATSVRAPDCLTFRDPPRVRSSRPVFSQLKPKLSRSHPRLFFRTLTLPSSLSPPSSLLSPDPVTHHHRCPTSGPAGQCPGLLCSPPRVRALGPRTARQTPTRKDGLKIQSDTPCCPQSLPLPLVLPSQFPRARVSSLHHSFPVLCPIPGIFRHDPLFDTKDQNFSSWNWVCETSLPQTLPSELSPALSVHPCLLFPPPSFPSPLRLTSSCLLIKSRFSVTSAGTPSPTLPISAGCLASMFSQSPQQGSCFPPAAPLTGGRGRPTTN